MRNKPNKRENIMSNVETMVTYSSKKNPFDIVMIKSDDSFVIVGDHEPTDTQLKDMVSWLDVEGYNAE